MAGIPTSFATCSLGLPSKQPSPPFPHKLAVIANAGFTGIELLFPDLLGFTRREISSLCQSQGLEIMMLQPFSNFEGWLEGSREREKVFQRAAGWIRIMQAVGTDLLQVGSADSRGISSSPEYLASDLAELADMLAVHGFRLAYENWRWATNSPTWKSVWEIVKRVDRPNIGLCLDTFQIAGCEWADPTASGGIMPRAENLGRSLEDLASTVPAESISDAYKPKHPLSDEPPEKGGLRARAVWSHSYQPLPFEGGYLPVVEITRAILKAGFRGWVSVEIFDEINGTEDVVAAATKAMGAHAKLLKECGV